MKAIRLGSDTDIGGVLRVAGEIVTVSDDYELDDDDKVLSVVDVKAVEETRLRQLDAARQEQQRRRLEQRRPKTITVRIIGQGTVTKEPEQENYANGTIVTLTATPRSGWRFVKWGGDVDTTDNPLVRTLKRDLDVTAGFQRI